MDFDQICVKMILASNWFEVKKNDQSRLDLLLKVAKCKYKKTSMDSYQLIVRMFLHKAILIFLLCNLTL